MTRITAKVQRALDGEWRTTSVIARRVRMSWQRVNQILDQLAGDGHAERREVPVKLRRNQESTETEWRALTDNQA